MNCISESMLDDYLDGGLAADEAAAVEVHISDCAACHGRLIRARALRERLRRLPMPEPDPQFLDRAIERAVQGEPSRRRWQGAGWALAASIVLAIALSAYWPGGVPSHNGIPGVTIALHEVREVSLAVESPRRLEGAVFKVLLPEGIEVAGYPGRREISWTGSLEPGKNLLVLPVRAAAGKGGDIVTSISHVDRSKTYVVNMVVSPAAEPSAIDSPADRVVM